MAKKIYKIGGVEIKSPPNGIEIEKYNVTNSGRTADAAMKIEFIAKKRKFILFYPVISTKEVKLIESLIDTKNMFFDFEYVEDGVQKRAVVYTGPLKKTPAWNDDVWYWKDFEVHLIEQ